MTDPNNRIVNPEAQPDDRPELTLRPKKLEDMIGQERVRENLEILITAVGSERNLSIMFCSMDLQDWGRLP